MATQVRPELGVSDGHTAVPPEALDRLGTPLKLRLRAAGRGLVLHHNPFVRHVIKRRRRDVRNPDGSPVFREVPVRLHGDENNDALEMSDAMAAAYGDSRAYCEQIAKVRPAAGILKTLLLRRIGSSLRAGLPTARKLRAGEETSLFTEEEANGTGGPPIDPGQEARDKLDSAIRHMEAAGDDDPKFSAILQRLRSGWAERGCILFSQYLDTVLWLAGHLALALPQEPVGIYGGRDNTYLFEEGRRRDATRDEVQGRVRDRSLRILVATDAASEGLNLQRLETLINIDLPWNPERLEQRKGRIDRLGQLASEIDILNLRYRNSVEDEVHHALSTRLWQIRDVFGTIPDTLEDVWVDTALGDVEAAKRRIDEVPARHPFDVRYAHDLPTSAWARCTQVLDRVDVQRALKSGWV